MDKQVGPEYFKLNHVEKWNENDVSQWLQTLGSGRCWSKYASLLDKEDIDGVTLCTLDLASLTNYGISNVHAKTILIKLSELKAERKKNKSTSPNFVIPITGKEMKRLQLFNLHNENIQQSKHVLEEETKKLKDDKESLLEAHKILFDEIQKIIDCNRIQGENEINQVFDELEKKGVEILQNFNSIKLKTKEVESKLLKSISQTKSFKEINKRSELIYSTTNEMFYEPFLKLNEFGSVKIDYNSKLLDLKGCKKLMSVSVPKPNTSYCFTIPPKPIEFSMDVRKTSVILDWQVPEYKVSPTYEIHNKTCNTFFTVDKPPYTLCNLSTGKQYEVSVQILGGTLENLKSKVLVPKPPEYPFVVSASSAQYSGDYSSNFVLSSATNYFCGLDGSDNNWIEIQMDKEVDIESIYIRWGSEGVPKKFKFQEFDTDWRIPTNVAHQGVENITLEKPVTISKFRLVMQGFSKSLGGYQTVSQIKVFRNS